MKAPRNKAELIDLLTENRKRFDACVAQIPLGRMEEILPGGSWNAKDNLTHMTFYEQQLADRLWEVLEGRRHTPLDTDAMTWQEQNPIIRERHKDDALADVLRSSQTAFQELLAAVERLPEAYFFEPQAWEGVQAPVLVWEVLESDVYDHYGEHIEYMNRLSAEE
jgi:hypothetical protein